MVLSGDFLASSGQKTADVSFFTYGKHEDNVQESRIGRRIIRV